VAPGLRHEALTRIDQDHGNIGGRCTRHHVSGVLFVTRRVSHHKGAPRRRKEAVGYIDRDPLLALVLEPVQQQ